jgi:SAM-dependent methyltransferase
MTTPTSQATNKPDNIFLDHYSREDRPTSLGLWLVHAISRRVFDFAGVASAGSVLEIGPGRGIFADLCLRHGLDYMAIEPNEAMAAALERKGAKVIRDTVPPLPPIDRKFGAVVMLSVMEHMNTFTDAMEVTRQVRDLLEPGGLFVVYCPDYLNWRQTFFNCDSSHNYVTTRRRLGQLLVNNGFADYKGCHLSGPVGGPLCFLMTAVVSRLPFAVLNAMFPRSKIVYKLYKIQITFLRKVLVVGRKLGGPEKDGA